ncbi:head decoration protein [Comamonas antarctica]|uniref:head decoration protein n=1 Tax=Comamonas antarctica TaxID=2743470 RepID=UPI0028E2DF50|nr:head decoration protein [Comamonas antarctica]
MATAALYSNPPLADFVLSEAHGQRSRDNIVVVQDGEAVVSGTVLKQVANGLGEFSMAEGATGNPTAGTITVGGTAAGGLYSVEFTTATQFKVFGPNGDQVGSNGTLGSAFSAGGLGFTLTAGDTAAKAGDRGILEVDAAGGVYEAFDGTGDAVAVLYSHLVAATGNTRAVGFTSDCEVKRSALTGLTAAGETALRTRGIKVRGTAGLPGISTPAL